MTSTRFPAVICVCIAAAACAEGGVDAASFATDPGGPKSNSPASAPSSEPDAATRPTAADDGATDASIDASTDVAIDVAIDSPIDGAAETSTGVDAGSPPTVDGTIAAGEYGVHVDGQNMQASPGTAPTTTWYVTWSATHLYIGVSAANVNEGLVLYLDVDPGGAQGQFEGTTYDNTKIATLPMRADFVAYVKSTYQEVRFVDGTSAAWSAPSTMGVSLSGSGSTRELAIPWTTIRAAGRPASFAWLGYLTSSGGYVYGPMPPTNAGGFVGTSATFASFYRVDDATPGSGDKPFAVIAP